MLGAGTARPKGRRWRLASPSHASAYAHARTHVACSHTRTSAGARTHMYCCIRSHNAPAVYGGTPPLHRSSSWDDVLCIAHLPLLETLFLSGNHLTTPTPAPEEAFPSLTTLYAFSLLRRCLSSSCPNSSFFCCLSFYFFSLLFF